MKLRIILNDETEVVEDHPDFQSVLDKYGRGNVLLMESIKNEE